METNMYQLKISLQGFSPEIWRRVLVNSDITLEDLHIVIQYAMGWYNCHLYQFIERENYYAPKKFELGGCKDTAKFKLNSILISAKQKLQYEYDFGDGWLHEIVLEKILPIDSKIQLPKCTGGKMNCPPEDCGGVWGYADLLDIISNPEHDEYEDTIEWLGEDFDPEYFNLEETNSILKTLQKTKKK